MAETKYSYSVSEDFPNGKVAPDRLTQEIQASTITVALDCINVNGDNCDVWFKAELSAGEHTTLDGVVAAHSGEPIPNPTAQLDSQNRTVTVKEPQHDGEARLIVTHLWTDPCTWYGDSERVEGGDLTDSGDGLTFTSGKEHWIDLTHGRVFREDRVSAPYLVKVYVDGVEKAERPPFKDEGGDYTINYEDGTVTFAESQAGKTITADYSYENGSTFYMQPNEGKKLWIEKSEAQFTTDITMNDTFQYQPAVIGGPTVGLGHIYKKWFDLVQEANGVYPITPALGGAKRGLEHDVVNIPFDFGPVRELIDGQGIEIRIWLEEHNAFDGEVVSVTFYCMEYDK